MLLFDMIFDTLYRVYYGFINPPSVKKKDDAIRFGLLGASQIAPIALIAPAKSHPEVIIAAVAARDVGRAETYAKKHNIPIVHSSYQDLLNDPSIDAVYIALPDSHHYEWALRSLKAKKHVLLEKPSCSNAAEARSLFRHPLVTSPNAPILLEAFHYRFHPAWHTFLREIHDTPQSGKLASVSAEQYFPKYAFGPSDIRWRFNLAGGCMMDFGTYGMSVIRGVMGVEPGENLTAKARALSFSETQVADRERVDEAMQAGYSGDGAVAMMKADLRCIWPISFVPVGLRDCLPGFGWPKSVVECQEKEADASSLGLGQHGAQGKCFVKRKVTYWNFLMPSIYHRIDVQDRYEVRKGDKVVEGWDKVKYLNAYTWARGDERAGERERFWWSTYSYQLEEFVNRIKGRKGTGIWIDGEESIKQMEAIDLTYRKAGMEVRPSTGFEL